MRVITLLNKCYPLTSFVYKKDHLEYVEGKESFVVDIIPRKNGIVKCSICGMSCSLYDKLKNARIFEFVPLWGIKVYFRYFMRRVSCELCGIQVEKVPWPEGKNHLTMACQLFLARWAKRLSWKETAEVFRTSWENVFRSVKSIVSYGLSNRSLEGITAIGVDEWQFRLGHDYVTLFTRSTMG